MRIQEITEELANCTVKEVNELSTLMNKNDEELHIPMERPELKKHNVTSPKEYGMKLMSKRKR